SHCPSGPGVRLRGRRLSFAAIALAGASLITAATFAQHAPPGAAGGAPYPNFDIRTVKADDRFPNRDAAMAYLEAFVPAPAGVTDLAVERVAGVAALETAFRGIRIENHAALGTTEIVRAVPGTGFLTLPTADRV